MRNPVTRILDKVCVYVCVCIAAFICIFNRSPTTSCTLLLRPPPWPCLRMGSCSSYFVKIKPTLGKPMAKKQKVGASITKHTRHSSSSARDLVKRVSRLALKTDAALLAFSFIFNVRSTQLPTWTSLDKAWDSVHGTDAEVRRFARTKLSEAI